MALIKKKNWHEELCILQNKMCCFLICFYNPNKFVSHTPRLEKGAVRQFRIAVCSQLRQRICCKAVAANNRRSPAVLQLRRHAGHRAEARAAAAAPGTAAARREGERELRATGGTAGEQQPRVPASPPADKDAVALQKGLCRRRSTAGASLRPPSCLLLGPRAVASSGRPQFRGQKPSAHPPNPGAHSFPSICISLSPPGPDSSPARREEGIMAGGFIYVFSVEINAQPQPLEPLQRCKGV